MRRDRNCIRSALTLVELLIVLALLALLVAGLGPSFKRLHEQARASVCTANLRALGMAHFTYAEENNDLLPSSDDWLATRTMLPRYASKPIESTNAKNPIDMLSTGQLWSYVLDPKTYLCPADTLERTKRRAQPLAITSYGANEDIRVKESFGSFMVAEGMVHLQRGSPNIYIHSKTLKRPSSVLASTNGTVTTDRSSKTFLLLEEHQSNTFDDGHVSSFDEYDDSLTLRHQKSGNMFFFDQHVESISSVDFNKKNAIIRLRYYLGIDPLRP